MYGSGCLNNLLVGVQSTDKTFVLTSSSSSRYIPFGKIKLTLENEKKDLERKSSTTDKADDMLMAFAMSKMSTPGLLQNPFYLNPLLNDALIAKFEVDFTKWLNSVLTPPEELESLDLAKVNAAEMWARSSKSEVAPMLAPSKEMVSSRYLSVKASNQTGLIFQY